MKFNPETDVGDLAGKIIFITGGTGGIGQETITQLAKHNATHIYFTGRSQAGAKLTQDRLPAGSSTKVTFIQCDQGDLTSINTAVTTHFKHDVLDIFIANAGIADQPPGLSKDGYEIQFATNHIGHALYIKLLLPALVRRSEQPGSDVRIIHLSSKAAYQSNAIDFATMKTTQNRLAGGVMRYGQSKLANAVYAAELARRYPQILSVSLHPGIVKTPMLAKTEWWFKGMIYTLSFLNRSKSPMLTPAEGAFNSLWAATANRELIKDGVFYEPVGTEVQKSKAMADVELANKLWEWTEKELACF